VVLKPTNSLGRVEVGITIAHNPLHGSGQAAFPHLALNLGDSAHAAERTKDDRCEQEADSGR
jgi:hypothetical protein